MFLIEAAISWKISDKEVWVCDLPVFQSLNGAAMTQGLLREMGVVERSHERGLEQCMGTILSRVACF